MRLGQIIFEERTRLGWTQRQLSAISGIKQTNIAHIEKDRNNPNFITGLRLWRALNIPYERLTVIDTKGGNYVDRSGGSDSSGMGGLPYRQILGAE